MARWKLGDKWADFTGLLNGTITVVNGVVTTEDRLEPAVSETIREHFEAERMDPLAGEGGEPIYPQGKITCYQLDQANDSFKGYTGMLHDTYQVVDGKVWVDPRLEPEASRILREHYGAIHVEGPTGDEVIAAEQKMRAEQYQRMAEEDRERHEARKRAALDDVRQRQGQVMQESGRMTAAGFNRPEDVTAHSGADAGPASGEGTTQSDGHGGVVQRQGITAAADPNA